MKRLFSLFLWLFAAQQTFAVIIAGGDGTGNIDGDGAGDGWDYVGSVNGFSGVYLGEHNGGYWVLTANHVGIGNFTLDSTTYNYVAGTGAQVGSADLYVFRIDAPVPSLPDLELNDTALTTGSSVVMVGNGRNRAAAQTTWYVDVDTNPDTWATSIQPGSDAVASGYQFAAGSSKRWGTNTVDGTAPVSGTSTFYSDFNNTTDDAHAVVGDSGGGVFFYNGTTWTLAGIMMARATYNGQPANAAVFGNDTHSVDISEYNEDILALIPEPSSTLLLALGALSFLLYRRRSGF